MAGVLVGSLIIFVLDVAMGQLLCRKHIYVGTHSEKRHYKNNWPEAIWLP